MLEGPPDVAALPQAAAAFGLLLPAMPDEPAALEVWAEHWPAVLIFAAMQTQWLENWAGRPTGLNYAALPAVEQRLGIRRRDSRAAFLHLRTLEAEALRWFAERQQG